MKLQLHKQLRKCKVGPTTTVDEITRTKKVDAVDETTTTTTVDETTRTKKVDAVNETTTTQATKEVQRTSAQGNIECR